MKGVIDGGKFSFANGTNAAFVDGLYRDFRNDPQSVDESWRKFFEGYEFALSGKPTGGAAGDNGLALGRHGLFGKQNLYDHSVHIPMIFCGPGIPSETLRDSLVYTVDVYPTLCEMAGIDIPESVLGKSMMKTIKEEEISTRDYLYYAYKDVQRAVTYQGWKLIEYNVNGVRSTQLFNIAEDPDEIHDLSGNVVLIEKVVEMRGKMLEARGEYGDNVAPFDKFWEGF